MSIEPAKRPRKTNDPELREASVLELFNTPLFEIPPVLDVRAVADFNHSHIVCAVSIPAEDGLNEAAVFQRIIDHDNEWGWCLQHPFYVVHDETTRDRAEWLSGVLTNVCESRRAVTDFDGADQAERLLRRVALQCKQVLTVLHEDFLNAFPCCCVNGAEFAAPAFFDTLGPLPRCGLMTPRIYIAGRQVQLTPSVLRALGVTHVVVNADALDVMDKTSGGNNAQILQERVEDVVGVQYLKCDVCDGADDPAMCDVLDGAARFLQQCSESHGVALVRMHGQSRSASVVCAFLMLVHGLSVDAAWNVVQEARFQIDSSLVCWDTLRGLRPSTKALADDKVA